MDIEGEAGGLSDTDIFQIPRFRRQLQER